MELHEAANFIKKIVSYDEKFDEKNFFEFGVEKPRSIAAIDGSSIKILDAGNFSIFLTRVAYVVVDDEIKKNVGKISIEILDDETKIDEIREKMEFDLISKINAEIILIDGVPSSLKKGIVGISKKSSLKIGNSPFLYLVKKYGDKIMGEKRWYYKIDETKYAVKFHPYSKFAFRVDAIDEQSFSKIAYFCNEIGIIGYPYPLAIAHRLAEIKKEEADYIKNRLREEAKIEDWENIFYDYHEYMEGSK